MLRTTASAFFFVLALSSVSAPRAAAQGTGRRALEMARTHMENGQELYASARYVEAAEEFLAAYQAREFGAFLYNAALCYERFGDPARAADLYQRYLDRDPNASDAAEVRAKITTLRAASAARTRPTTTPTTTETPTTTPTTTETPTTPTTTETPTTPPTTESTVTVPATPPTEALRSMLSVTTEPEGARVYVKHGDTIVADGPSPFAESLEEGEYRLFVEHPDFRTVEQPIRIRGGKVYVVFIALRQAQFLGYLRVASAPTDARVYIDDRAAGSQPLPYANEIPTGSHHLWIERAGYAAVERDVEVGLGEQVDVRVELDRVDFGRVRMIANVRPADVYVDGRRVGAIPYEGDIPSGRRRIRVSAAGMKDWEQTVDIQRGQVTPMRVRLRPSPERGGAYATLTLSAASLGGAIALSVFQNRLHTELDREFRAGTLANDDPRITEGRMLTIGADVAYGFSGLAALLSLYYFVHDPLPDSEGTVLEPRDWSFVPTLDPLRRTATLTARGRF